MNLDLSEGMLRVQGMARLDAPQLLFSGLTLNVAYPRGVLQDNLSGNALTLVSGSFIRVISFLEKGASGTKGTVPLVIEDHVPPTIRRCPADVTVMTAIGKDYANVAWLEPQVIDNVGVLRVETSHTSGSRFFLKQVCGITHKAHKQSVLTVIRFVPRFS